MFKYPCLCIRRPYLTHRLGFHSSLLPQSLIRQKQGERERKKQELEAEFSSVFSEIREKKQELQRLEQSIVDMEGQRQRKDREFARLQVCMFA